MPRRAGTLRVIAGALRGRGLEGPTWTGLRPTSDKLRETLFSMLGHHVEGARVLDGFAGTGALGLEALSRGARATVFIESDRRAQALIDRNAARCNVSDRCVIIRADFRYGLADLRDRPNGAPFGLVLLDPPYDLSAETVLQGVDDVLDALGIVVLEHARRQRVPERVGRLAKVRAREAGDSALTFYAKVGDGDRPGRDAAA
jgi:16S rRNA (guanine966-N2)-methyltransferase